MQKVLIIGAASAIAEATARVYASRGAKLFLVARSAQKLQDLANDLKVRGATEIATATLDVNDTAQHSSALNQAWTFLQAPDVVLLAHGTLPNQQACQTSAETALAEFATNATSTLALLTLITNSMEAQHHGTIAVISSVAGDRGRASNYLYGSAKAAVSAFLSGLRQRLAKQGINVLTIKPGFVDTPMTRDFKKGALWAKPGSVARGIVRAIDRRKAVVYLPWFWSVIMLIIKHIPEFVFKRIKL
jgi:decaprenylphospho-beta-D-erythro-pentofuranosid-2-ulose 2-reductase